MHDFFFFCYISHRAHLFTWHMVCGKKPLGLLLAEKAIGHAFFVLKKAIGLVRGSHRACYSRNKSHWAVQFPVYYVDGNVV